MADKKAKAKAKDPESGEAKVAGLSPLVKLLAIGGVVVAVGAGSALGLYFTLLKPRLQPAEAAATGSAAKTDPHSAASDPHEDADHDAHFAHAEAIEFDEASVNVNAEGPDGKPSLLSFKCAIVISEHVAAQALGDKAKKPLFASILLKLHSNRTKTELTDPRVKESILRQARQQCNALLKKLLPESKATVIEVLHVKYTLFEL